jgi:hypothetical protein
VDPVGDGLPPSGTVTFFLGNLVLGNSPVAPAVLTGYSPEAALATLATSQLPVGLDNVTAQYSGNANYSGSASVAGTYINVQIPTTTTLTLTPSAPVIAQGTSLTLTAQVTPGFGGETPGGVAFTLGPFGGTLLGGQTLICGQAQVTVNGGSNLLPTGDAVPLTATFGGPFHQVLTPYGPFSVATYAPSSATTAITVNPQPGTDFSLTFNLPSFTLNQPGGQTLILHALNGFAGTVNFAPNACSISPAGSGFQCALQSSALEGDGDYTIVEFPLTAPSVSTTRRWMRPIYFTWRLPGLAAVLLLLLLAFPLRARRFNTAFGLTVVLMIAAVCVSCGRSSAGTGGAGGSTFTPPPVYTVTVTGTCGPLTHTASSALHLQ